jgi:hypothetical protein
MWKRVTLAIGIAAVLAIPAGMAVAGTSDPAEDLNRDRVTTTGGDQARDMSQDRARTRDRVRLQDPANCDGTGPRGVSHHGAGSGSAGRGAGYGHGAMDGTGPIHAHPEDGTGFRYGGGGS